MKYYLAGPMTGYKDFNIPVFKSVKEDLEKQGYEIVLPVDIDNENLLNLKWSWGDYLAEDIRTICNRCNGIMLLPGWTRSRGAKLEVACALMQSLKDPNFEFWSLSKKGHIPVRRGAGYIALKWFMDWELYNKEALVGEKIA